MNKQICIIILLLTCRICNAQNLVPNPSFEDTVACPTTLGEVSKAKYWHTLKYTPDYFNSCSSVMACSVPNNNFNYQTAATGEAYMGLFTYYPTNYREVIGAFLNSPLVVGNKYYVTFKTSFAYSPNYAINIAINKLGIFFSTYDFLSNPPGLFNYCQIKADSIITDTLGWTTVRGSFIADSSYSFISIGNFFDNIHTDTLNFPGNQSFSYYFIDDVCVSTDSLTCNPLVGINEVKKNDEIIISPNPFIDKINIRTKRNEPLEVSLYDVTSRKIFNQTFTNTTSINTEQLAKGIYLYEVRNKSGVIKKGKVVKE